MGWPHGRSLDKKPATKSRNRRRPCRLTLGNVERGRHRDDWIVVYTDLGLGSARAPLYIGRGKRAGVAHQAADQGRRTVLRRQRDRHRGAHGVRSGGAADWAERHHREPRRRRDHDRLEHGRQGRPGRLHAPGEFDLARRGGVDLRETAVQCEGRSGGDLGAGQHSVRHRHRGEVQDDEGLSSTPARSRAATSSTAPPASAPPASCSWSASD